MTLDRRRVTIETITPQVGSGRFPIKRIVSEEVIVEADVFADGHDAIACALLYRREGEPLWYETPMLPLGNDQWRASFTVTELGRYLYTIEGWPDPFSAWRQDLIKRIDADQDSDVDMRIGSRLVGDAARRAHGEDGARLAAWADRLAASLPLSDRRVIGRDEQLATLMARYPDRGAATRYERELVVEVDRLQARFSTWYEMFPRSAAPEPGRHGTLKDCIGRLDYVAAMGFDVLYLPPIHPIGRTFRKGRNNVSPAGPDDVGSPWAIGAAEGGHTAIHPDLGTFDDLERLRREAASRNLELALDLAFQCAPDHPWVEAHPEWFRQRPDGTIQYAENPPRKYQDIYPLDFDTADWKALWQELRDVVRFWIDRGIRIFRVDNPHTKPFPFWEWLIADIKRTHPDVILLSEAFTRPKVMYRLAKLGFTQSYTYFTWRNTKWDLTHYFLELMTPPIQEFFRPNLWPNTPDILPGYLQAGGRPAFISRLVLAATLAASYGIYGPAFELCELTPRERGSEEYMNAEKYESKHWNLDAAWSLKDLIARVNRARADNLALQTDRTLHFHATDNDMLICYSKTAADRANAVIVVVNLDFQFTQSGWVHLNQDALGLGADESYEVHDLLTDQRYRWQGARNYIELSPQRIPAHIFKVNRTGRHS